MFIIGIGTAVPERAYAQRECWDALQGHPQFEALAPRSQSIIKKVLCGQNGIETRHLSLEKVTDAFELTPDVLQKRFTQNAPILASAAARKALAEANCTVQEIDAVLISTCTGYLCPGLTSYVSEALGLRPDVFALDLVGQGCGAALPNLRTAETILASGRARKVLSICVEVCSAAFYLDNDPGVLISGCLFGDGAGAVVLAGEAPVSGRQVRWTGAASHLVPTERDSLRFEHAGGMLRNILTPQVPDLAAKFAGQLFDDTLRAAGVKPTQVTGWVLHAGGRDIITLLGDRLQLSEDDVRHSRAVLGKYGNISSAAVIFVLQEALHDSVPDGLWWMSSFGAGFSCHGSLLEVSTL